MINRKGQRHRVADHYVTAERAVSAIRTVSSSRAHSDPTVVLVERSLHLAGHAAKRNVAVFNRALN